MKLVGELFIVFLFCALACAGKESPATSKCPQDFIEVDGGCCPEKYPSVCNKRCYPKNCVCEKDMPVCPGEKYCAPGLLCQQSDDCVKDKQDKYVCLPDKSELCNQGHICPKEQVCTDSGCCPSSAPYRCGGKCCHDPKSCIQFLGFSFCLEEGSSQCSKKVICTVGTQCTPDKTSCMLNGEEYCSPGIICPQGYRCVNHKLQCCPKVTSLPCGEQCYPDHYKCVNDRFAIPYSANTCPNQKDWCPYGWKCGSNVTCLPDNAEECGSAWCEIDKKCVQGNCCDKDDALNILCGGKCCPKYYKCEQETCFPEKGHFCQKGVWCPEGSKCSQDKNRCLAENIEECPSGKVCAAGEVCDKKYDLCCKQELPVGCGTVCCSSEQTCLDTKNGKQCAPANSNVCSKDSLPLWCPQGSQCGKLRCLPSGFEECPDGQVCAIGFVCSQKQDGDRGYLCCAPNTEVCGNICCEGMKICVQGKCVRAKGLFEFCDPSQKECIKPLQCLETMTIGGLPPGRGPAVCAVPEDVSDLYVWTGGKDRSEELDDYGFFDGQKDKTNWHGFCVLEDLCVAVIHVKDNREGDEWPHGPLGNMHIIYYDPSQGEPKLQKHFDVLYSKYKEIIMRGPTAGEWGDNQYLLYKNTTLVNWKAWNALHPQSKNTVGIIIYERDACEYDLFDFPVLGWLGEATCDVIRSDDVLAVFTIRRQDTESVEGKKYFFNRNGKKVTFSSTTDCAKEPDCDGYWRVYTRIY